VYLITGLVSAVMGPLLGRASDAFGKFRIFAFGCMVTIIMVLIYTRMSNVTLWTLITVARCCRSAFSRASSRRRP